MAIDLQFSDGGARSNVSTEEDAAHRLEGSSNFRVLRRLAPPILRPEAMTEIGHGRRLAVLLDTETTGVDHAHDVAIELSMLAVTYDEVGLHDVVGVFEGLEDPGRPLSPDVLRLTGLTDAELRDRRIDREALEKFLTPVSLVIAHNARFDRTFAERLHPTFSMLPWACSLEEIPWAEAGAGSRKLEDLLRRLGLFHDGHRALTDCHALLRILNSAVGEGRPAAFVELLRTARRTTIEIRALDAPYNARHALKARRYRWLKGNDGKFAWTILVDERDQEGELAFLRPLLPPNAEPPVRRLTAFNRHK